jgi:hypothetical protein
LQRCDDARTLYDASEDDEEGPMEYTSKRVEATRGRVRDQEKRIARQREKIERAIIDRHPADELQARLLIMEQSLIAMARFLRNLEQDLWDELGIHHYPTQKRIRAGHQARAHHDATEALHEPTAPSRAAEVPSDERTPFDTVMKAMQKLTDRS